MDVAFPEMGDSVAEGTVLEWLKQVGDTVAVDDPLVEISTDKVDAEMPSPVAGTIAEILVQVDETVPVGSILCRINATSVRAGARRRSRVAPRGGHGHRAGRRCRQCAHGRHRGDPRGRPGGQRPRHRRRLACRAAARAGA